MPYDVLVIGGGHAGCEAAVAAARLGRRVLLLTSSLETIGHMSCNPAMGGIAKGTVIREVDALGGIMGRASDLATIQFRMLNRSKGEAVWSPRAQCDRTLYKRAVRRLLEDWPTLELAQGMATSLLLAGARVAGARTGDGREFRARTLVLTAGTFLRGRIHIGTDTRIPAGRAGEPPSVELAEQLQGLGLEMARFKTGTPPRVDGRSVDFSRLVRQDGEEADYRFSVWARHERPEQRPCWITYAGEPVKEIIRRHLASSALYGGAISGRGPRYCPSIEDKVVKFPEAPRHQVFLEPEGLDTTELYVNGLSTSLPADVQLQFLHAVPGLERCRMTRPGYAIEYDFLPPTQLFATLESKALAGLFCAGQVNGTTGYEEAGGQGVVAGINAARVAGDEPPIVLGRDEAYVGVLVDDLVMRGVDEPYRLFTSRSEFRLLQRQDNAWRRLGPRAADLGLLTAAERALLERRLSRVGELAAAPRAGASSRDGGPEAPSASPVEETLVAEAVALDLKYEGYVARERAAAARLGEMGAFALTSDLPYPAFASLSTEARQKLAALRPLTLAQASRIPGVSPSDLQNLVVEVLKARRKIA